MSKDFVEMNEAELAEVEGGIAENRKVSSIRDLIESWLRPILL